MGNTIMKKRMISSIPLFYLLVFWLYKPPLEWNTNTISGLSLAIHSKKLKQDLKEKKWLRQITTTFQKTRNVPENM